MIALERKAVPKIWGRCDLPRPFDTESSERIGEIWYEAPDGTQPALLVKYLFTSERLSVQVHPDDRAARARGLESGKEEAWLVIGAEAGAEIGVGLTREASAKELRAAAIDGSIEQLLAWRPVKAGDFFHLPPGTVHAIGSGVSLIEVQQYSDVTYRLYDYGRPRELHLDDAIAVANAAPYDPPFDPPAANDGRRVLAAGGAFVLERCTGGCSGRLAATTEAPVWIIPLAEGAHLGASRLAPGEVWMATSGTILRLDPDGDVLIAYAGGSIRPGLVV